MILLVRRQRDRHVGNRTCPGLVLSYVRWIPVLLAVSVFAAPAQGQWLKPSMREQVKIGQQAAKEIRSNRKNKVLPDTDPRVVMIREIGARLLAQIPESEHKSKPWVYTFDVVDSKDVNAFALPGGAIFFHTGLLERLTTVDQIAGILGHEIVHVRKEHWARDYAKTLEQQGLIMIGGLLLGANSAIMQGASLVETYGLALPRSRKAEEESDKIGFEMMVAAGYNPRGMIEVFEMLHKTTGKHAPPEFMSTHPSEAGRIKKLETYLLQAGRPFPPQTPIPFEAGGMPRPMLWARGFLLGG